MVTYPNANQQKNLDNYSIKQKKKRMKKNILFLLIAAFAFTANAQNSYNSMLNNALKFIDTPYAANTLEVNNEEELVVNCDEVDCTTFVEYTLAMALCSDQGDDMLESEFAENLQKIRYRNGEINGYPSRLHYATEWVNDNVRKGLIEDITEVNSPVTTRVNLSFMSNNADKYAQLKNSPTDKAQIAAIERELSGQTIHYFPKDNLPLEGVRWIKNGDIIMFTTNIEGLDVSHMGIAIYVKDNLHLLHASSKSGKVVVEKMPLNRQLARDKSITGIRVLRMK